MIMRVAGYLEILDHHGIGWTCLCSGNPGMIIYEDPYQVVAKP